MELEGFGRGLTGVLYQEAVYGQHLMDPQRCQNHGPVRLLVPLLEFNHKANDSGKLRGREGAWAFLQNVPFCRVWRRKRGVLLGNSDE